MNDKPDPQKIKEEDDFNDDDISSSLENLEERAEFSIEKGEKGYLMHIFRGQNNPSELACFRKICMKHGMQAWEEMHSYLPWRSRSDLRTTLCRMIRKNAVSEYANIRADPIRIQEDNDKLHTKLKEGELALKGGFFVNQKWDKSEQERKEEVQSNMEKYNIPEEEAERIEIPPVMQVEYLQKCVEKRRISLLLYRAACIASKALKTGIDHPDLMLEGLAVLPASQAHIRMPRTTLKYTRDPTEYLDHAYSDIF